ncbi:lipoprotein [Spiroplasma sp. ald]|uniref:lipoprotein n=1 Tax=Spiroplasma sp. ald TaxID=2490849 RepID=UPI0037DD029A
MKKIISILGTITLIGTSTTSLVACNTPQYSEEQLKEQKEKHNLNINGNILEWISPQEKPFNKVDNKYYFAVWRGNKTDDWKIIKFLNDTNNEKKIDDYNKYSLVFKPPRFRYYTLLIKEGIISTNHTWHADDGSYFKSVYRWNKDIDVPNLVIDENGNIKVNT